jgi:tetratricopeptide (TPR) repeat protein
VRATADLAREALRLADADPRRAADLADLASTRARTESDFAAAAIAERARGLAQFHLEDVDAALRSLREAIRLGRRAGSATVTAEARMTLAFVLNWRGRPSQALRTIDTAIGELSGVERARATAQRGTIRHQIGRFEEARHDYRAALPVLRRAGDGRWVAQVLVNRGLGHAHRGEFDLALSDLREGERIYQRLGLELSVGHAQHNLGYVAVLRADIPAALRYFDQAEDCFRRLGSQVAPLLRDRSELLLSARLVAEAREAAEEAIEACLAERRQVILPEVRLILARAQQLQGDVDDALDQARQAEHELSRLGQKSLAALARVTVLTLQLMNDPTRSRTAQMEHAVTGTAGMWPAVVIEGRLMAARVAAQLGRTRDARAELGRATTARLRGPATIRAMAWYAEAQLRQSTGNPRGAKQAARAGLRILDDYASALGASDIRAHVAGYRGELAKLGLQIAVGEGSARRAFEWAELGRATHLHHALAVPRRDASLADAMAELRLVTHELDEQSRAGRVSASLRQRQLALERQVRDHHRRLRASSEGALQVPSVARLSAALGPAATVEYVALDDDLWAITVVDGRVRMRVLASMRAVLTLADRLPFALHRLARRSATAASRTAALALLHATADQLDQLMLAPLTEVGDRPLLVVPTGRLQWLPWSVLPSCAGRPVTVAPSATVWHSAITRRGRRGRVVVASGPGLPGARAEAEAVASIYGVKALLGGAATVDTVAAGLDGAALAHLATHGRVRSDNPQFGSLSLADGPLMIYDLEKLRRVPHTVVVAACDAGRPVVPVGDELLGLTASLLAQGSTQLVASVLPILDTETWPLMVSFHDRLRSGDTVAAALAAAQQGVAATGPEGIATAAGFLTFGAGFTAPNVVQ